MPALSPVPTGREVVRVPDSVYTRWRTNISQDLRQFVFLGLQSNAYTKHFSHKEQQNHFNSNRFRL